MFALNLPRQAMHRALADLTRLTGSLELGGDLLQKLRSQLMIDRPGQGEQDGHLFVVELQRRHGASRKSGELLGRSGGYAAAALTGRLRMTERNRKLPQSTYYLRAARAGIQMLEEQKPMDDRLLFLVVGILACLRAVQHCLLHHDRRLSPQHEAAIDEWKKLTPMDGKKSRLSRSRAT